MRKTTVVAVAAMFALVAWFGTALAINPPGDDHMVTNYGKKPQVNFKHSKHKDKKCTDCHHQATADSGHDLEKPETYKCGGCHKEEDEGEKPKLETAVHGSPKKGKKGVCWDCHREKDAEQKKKCKECHLGDE